jgi:DNA-binding phage protein
MEPIFISPVNHFFMLRYKNIGDRAGDMDQMSTIDTAIQEARERIIAIGGRIKMARRAGLGRETLARFHRDDWLPSARTLQKIDTAWHTRDRAA